MQEREYPALAGAVGQYSETRPRQELREHFQCMWTSVLPAGQAPEVAVVPDGCVDLLWSAGRLLVVGPDITAARPQLAPGAAVLGARFQPGAALHWLGVPMSDLVGRKLDLADLWGPRAQAMAGQLAEAEANGRQAAVFQSELAKRIPLVAPPSQEAAAIFALVQASAGTAGGAIPLVLRHLGLSERTLRRRSHEHFGYGAKTLERILRFQRVLSLARASPEAGLAAIAADAGYADQAHLSREIQSLAGMTAKVLLGQVRA